LGDLGINVRIILKWILKKYGVSVGEIKLTQDRFLWQPLVNTVTSLQVPLNVRHLLAS